MLIALLVTGMTTPLGNEVAAVAEANAPAQLIEGNTAAGAGRPKPATALARRYDCRTVISGLSTLTGGAGVGAGVGVGAGAGAVSAGLPVDPQPVRITEPTVLLPNIRKLRRLESTGYTLV